MFTGGAAQQLGQLGPLGVRPGVRGLVGVERPPQRPGQVPPAALDRGVGPGGLGQPGDRGLAVDHDDDRGVQGGQLLAHRRPGLIDGDTEQDGVGASSSGGPGSRGQAQRDVAGDPQPPRPGAHPGAVQDDHRGGGWAVDQLGHADPVQQWCHVGHCVMSASGRGRRSERSGDLRGAGEGHLAGQLGQVHSEPVGAAAAGQTQHQQQRCKDPAAGPAADVRQVQTHHSDRDVDPPRP